MQGDVTPENYIGHLMSGGIDLVMAARAARKGCSLQALSTNAGNIFIGFDNTVTLGGAPGIWVWELQPGQAVTIDDYRGPLYAISIVNQVLGTGEW